MVNRLIGEQTATFHDTFVQLTGAPLQSVDFRGDPDGSRGMINDWVAEQS